MPKNTERTITFSIPTTYKGIQMRSRLEAETAHALDILKVKWEYERESFLLQNGTHYFPDFYLPELDTWLEVKGIIGDRECELAEMFARENVAEMMLVSGSEGIWFSNKDKLGSHGRPEELYLGKCSFCGHFFFCGGIGVYSCRKCGGYNGDSDLINRFYHPTDEIHIGTYASFDKEWLNQLVKGWKNE